MLNVIQNFFVVFNQVEVVSFRQYNFLLQLYHKNFCEMLNVTSDIDMELPPSYEKFYLWSTQHKSGLHLQTYSWQNSTQELVLISWFWQEWNLFIELMSISMGTFLSGSIAIPNEIWDKHKEELHGKVFFHV